MLVHMTRAVLLLALTSVLAARETAVGQHSASRALVTVPFVGCASEGMSGPVSAPSGKPKKLHIAAAAAAHLAYYFVAQDLSVLAPRGWHCLNIYDSSGSYLFVTPEQLDPSTVLSDSGSSAFQGSLVALSWFSGFTSGRHEVSAVISLVFPTHQRFADEAASVDEISPQPHAGPYRDDTLHCLSNDAVEYVTASGKQGLGTQFWLKPTLDPISGAELLVKDNGDCCDLISLAVRLPSADTVLSPVIVQQAERAESHPRFSVPAGPSGSRVR